MTFAVLSDIHSNLNALEAVLEDIRRRGVERIYCLGDVIGLGGTQPRDCLELAETFECNLLGNHEEALLFGAKGFNAKAKAAIDWTRVQLNAGSRAASEQRKTWEFLRSLPRQHEDEQFIFFHGSTREPTREYVFPHDCSDIPKMDEIFSSPRGSAWVVCFVGHTHVPGVLVKRTRYEFRTPEDLGYEYRYAGATSRAIVNVGSVGQPRDGDWRACYVTVDNEMIEFHRVEYDLRALGPGDDPRRKSAAIAIPKRLG